MKKVIIYFRNIFCSEQESYYCIFVFVNTVSVYLRRNDFVSIISDKHCPLVFFFILMCLKQLLESGSQLYLPRCNLVKEAMYLSSCNQSRQPEKFAGWVLLTTTNRVQTPIQSVSPHRGLFRTNLSGGRLMLNITYIHSHPQVVSLFFLLETLMILHHFFPYLWKYLKTKMHQSGYCIPI